MKKIIFAIFAATAFLASCTKEVPVAEPQDIRVKFTVADKAAFGADTKAVKTGWEVGDEIIVVFKSSTNWLDCINETNTVKLTKTATGWTSDASNITLALLNGTDYFAV